MEELLRNLAGPDWATPWTVGSMLLPFLAGLVGILANAAHRKFRGAKIDSIADYFTRDLNYTVGMLAGYFIAFLLAAKILHMNVAVGGMIGFLCDNILNKYTPRGDR